MTEESAPRSTTLNDVALLAGASPATVSRFLNKPEIVAKATGERIRQAIETLGYVPNLMAGGLASSKSKMVAVLIPHLTQSLFNDTMETMVEELTNAGTTVMLGLTGGEPERTDHMIRAAVGRRVDAIISTAPVHEGTVDLVKRFPGLFIEIWDLPASPLGIAVGFSHRAAGRALARFIVSRGYVRPLLVSAVGGRSRMRREGFLEEWAALGGGAISEAEVDAPSRFGHARRVFANMRRAATLPDVVVCGSDFLAQGMIVEASAAGLKVPDDLAVVGFGNAGVASDMRPTITTVEIDGGRIAREVIQVIHEHGGGTLALPRSIDVGFRLIARESA